MKRDLMFCSLGNGLTVCDRLHEQYSDYQKIAHINRNRQVTYYLPLDPEHRRAIEHVAMTDDSSVSTSQPERKVFAVPPVRTEYLGAFEIPDGYNGGTAIVYACFDPHSGKILAVHRFGFFNLTSLSAVSTDEARWLIIHHPSCKGRIQPIV